MVRSSFFVSFLLFLDFYFVSAVINSNVDSVIRSFYEFQNQQNNVSCVSWSKLFASPFQIVDPYGSPAITTVQDALSSCESEMPVFKVINTEILQVFSPGGNETAVLWHCTSISAQGCKLDFSGVDLFTLVQATSGSLIASVVGYFDPNIPMKQMNCTV